MGKVAGTVLKVGGSILKGKKKKKAAKKAAKAQAAASEKAIAFQRQAYNDTRQDLAGYRSGGGQAYQMMAQQLGLTPYTGDGQYSGFTESPGYQFNYDQTMKGAHAASAAGGYRNSGRAMKEAMNYASGLASQEYDSYFNRLYNTAGMGLRATQIGAQAGQNFAANAGNAIMRAGDARAQGLIGAGNATGGMIDDLGGFAGEWLGNRDARTAGSHGQQTAYAPNQEYRGVWRT